MRCTMRRGRKREEAALQETEDFLERVFQGRMGMMLNTMVQQRALSKEDMEELHKILEQAEGQDV